MPVIEAQCTSILVPHDHRHVFQKRKSQLLGLDRRQRQICPFCMAELMVATAAKAAQLGGSARRYQATFVPLAAPQQSRLRPN